jgi:hypothetical protein
MPSLPIIKCLQAATMAQMDPGLADGTAVSLESINFPGYFIRHRNGEIPWSIYATYEWTAVYYIDFNVSGSEGCYVFCKINK